MKSGYTPPEDLHADRGTINGCLLGGLAWGGLILLIFILLVIVKEVLS